MKVVNVSQRSPAWRHWREQGLSASEAAVIMGRSPHKTPWRLWAEKTGLVREQTLDNNPLVRVGIEEEAKALQRFEDKHEVMLLPLCGESARYPLLRASFDGVSANNEPVEVKCPHETIFLEVLLNREQSPVYQLHWCQVQQQLLVADAERGYLCFYHQGQDLEFVIARDEAFLTQLIDTAMDFWSAVKTGKEPPKDPERDLYLPHGAAEQQWQSLAAHYRRNAVKMDDIKTELKTLETQQARIEHTLVGLMGDYLAAEHSGLRVSRFQVQGSVQPNRNNHLICYYIKPSSLKITKSSYE